MTKTEKEKLRQNHYNGTIINKVLYTHNLAVFQIKPDQSKPSFLPGQFVNLGLFNFENPYNSELGYQDDKLIKRPYSLSSPLIHEGDELHQHIYASYYELFVAKIEAGEFTPKLFELNIDDRVYITEKALGTYLMPDHIKPDDTIIFASTGTGLAPHNTMVVDLLNKVHSGKIIVFDCVRYQIDLAYKDQLLMLEKKFDNFHYIPLVTRESKEKMYIQDFFSKNKLETDYTIQIDPKKTHVFCCGNPNMIGIPKRNRETNQYDFPIENGLIEILMNKYQLTVHRSKEPGQIHFEKYW